LNISHWLQVVGLIVGFVGALLLTATEIKRRKAIEAESGTYVEKNLFLEKSLKQKSLLAILSTVLLAIPAYL
jgi:hypothetical protein